MTTRAAAFPITSENLGLTYLAQFVGVFSNQHVRAEMARAGYADLRDSHGFLIQHLLREPQRIGELARLLGVTQQAVSKTVAELTRAGYLETVPGDDARVRVVRLAARGHAAVLLSRRIRAKLERRLSVKLGERRAAQLRASLAELLDELGGMEGVTQRRVPSPAGLDD